MAEDKLQFDNIHTQTIESEWLQEKSVTLDVLRLDKVHPVISGNKWFKLKYYLQDMTARGFTELGTFGGAYSNHIVATAYAACLSGIKSRGFIRGEEPALLSPTLQQAKAYEMQLQFISRADYQNKEIIKNMHPQLYWINEGGYGMAGAKGASEILSFAYHLTKYSHIVCATGTGTMLAGICESALAHQQVIGISVLKNNFSITREVNALTQKRNFIILHDYHFGGYAKHPPALINFIQHTWHAHQLPLDIVYTSKTFYATRELVMRNDIKEGSKILMIHSGGLQGNLSLPAGVLPFL